MRETGDIVAILNFISKAIVVAVYATAYLHAERFTLFIRAIVVKSRSLIISVTVLISVFPLLLIVRESIATVSHAVTIIVRATSVWTHLHISGVIGTLVTIVTNTITIEILPLQYIIIIGIAES